MRRLVLVVAAAGCNSILSIPGTIENSCAADITCPVDRPRCETFTGVCRQCLLDEHCPSGLCLPDKSCAEDAEIIFATSGMPAGDCSSEAMSCDLPTALSLVTSNRHIIFLSGALPFVLTEPIVVDGPLVLRGKGMGVPVDAAQASPVFDVRAGGLLTTDRLALTGATGAIVECSNARVRILRGQITNGATIGNFAECTTEIADTITNMFTGVGITSTGGSLEFTRSTLRRATVAAIDATSAVISNSVIRVNGTTESEFTVRLRSGKIVHSMVGANITSTGFGNAIVCGDATIDSSIVFANESATQLANDCADVRYTLSETESAGEGNLVGDPLVDPSDGNHVLPGSPCAGAGNPDLPRDLDIDRQVRPNPEGTASDCGADEIP